MRNFFVDYRGGATSRPGTEFVGQAKISSNVVRLVPFQFSTQQTYILEFGNNYIRFITSGSYVLENSIAIAGATNSTSAVINVSTNSYSTGDWVETVTAPVGLTRLNGTSGLANRSFIVGATTSTTFAILDPITGNPIDSSTWTPWASGGSIARIYTVTSPWAGSDLQFNPTTMNPGLKFTQSADVLTITHPSYHIYDINRFGQTNWTIVQRTFSPKIAAPTYSTASVTVSGGTVYQYQITAVSSNGSEESLPSAIGTAPGSAIMSINGSAHVSVSWIGVSSASEYNIYRAPEVPNGTPPPGSLFGLIGSTVGLQFIDTNFEPDFSTTPPSLNDPFANGQIQSYNVVSSGSSYSVGTSASITSGDGTGATLILVINGGNIAQALPQDTGINYTTASITITDPLSSGSGGSITPNIVNPDNYPGTTAYFQERQCFAASNPEPEAIWLTQPGNFSNMDYSTPSRPDDAINISLTGTSPGGGMQVNAVKHMVPMPSGLVVLTAGGAWQVSGGSPTTALTPANINAQAQAYNGCSDVAPIPVNYDIVFVQARGSIFRDLAYNYFINIYTGTDISMLSSHLFFGHQIIEMAYAEEPFKIIWPIRDDGTLLSLTFLKEQDVYGWARHDTQGQFLSVAQVVEGQENAVYFVIQRLINGNLVKYIERMASRDFYNDGSLAWFLDCAEQNTFPTPAATLSVASINNSASYYTQYPIEEGDTIALTASPGVFSSGSVGSTLRFNNGNILVQTYSSSTSVSGLVLVPPYDATQASSGSWSLTAPFVTVSGLDHLEGQTVGVLADGNVFATASVSQGAITLASPAATVLVGLSYQCQLQTLPLEVGGVTETIQGKFKKFAYLTARVFNTRGLKAGQTFATLTPIRVAPPPLWGQVPPLQTGDLPRFVMDPLWQEPGQICFQVDDPVPCQLLAIVPEITVGSSPG